MMVKCWETEAIYRWKTLCSHTALDKVLTGNRMAAIVKHVSSHYILLAKILFLHDRSDASFLLTPSPLAFFFFPSTLKKAVVVCQLGQSARLAQEDSPQREVPVSAVT